MATHSHNAFGMNRAGLMGFDLGGVMCRKQRRDSCIATTIQRRSLARSQHKLHHRLVVLLIQFQTTFFTMNASSDDISATLVVSDDRCCSICSIVKRRMDFPLSLRKAPTECRACLQVMHRGSVDSIQVCADDTISYQPPQPQFVSYNAAEIV